MKVCLVYIITGSDAYMFRLFLFPPNKSKIGHIVLEY